MSETIAGGPSVALVTGGSRGIGRAIVEVLAAEGWRVAFTWVSDEAAARAVAQATGGLAFALDMRDRARPATLVAEVERALGPVDALVNNAGVRREAILAMTSDALWDEVMETNLGGAFRCCRAVLPGMVYRRRGAIVNVSSRSATAGLPGQTAYAASKAGLLGLTRSLAREVGRKGVRVNAVVPGFVSTELTASLAADAVGKLRAGECLPVGTSAADVARTVAFLLSDRAAALTGQVIAVDSGASA
ncbi:MAG TPA: SDR family oxidoreductase [Vicinamibacteria bacterium]|nr:SDR family oxidoreductase [Vicinamibacteria bacterium]